MTEEIVKMSPKGQLVVPKIIRERAGFSPGNRFIAIPIENGVVFKKLDIDLEQEYEELSQIIQERFQADDLDDETVEDAIDWARE